MGSREARAGRSAPAGGTTPAATAKGTAIKDPAEGGYVAKMKALSVPAELAKGRALGDDAAKVKLEIFEDFCVVTESVRHGIPVVVGVETHAS